MDIFTLLVLNVFGNFWVAIMAIIAIYYIILVMGGVSQYTANSFISLFLIAMTWGYGNLLIAVLVSVPFIFVHLIALPRLVNSAST